MSRLNRTKKRSISQDLGVSQKAMQRIDVLKRSACPELIKAAHAGVLPPKRAEIIAKALNHHDQRQLLKVFKTMSPGQRHDAITVLRDHLKTKHHKAG